MSVLAQVDAGNTPLLVTGMIGLAALGWKFVDFLRMLANVKTNVSGVITQLVAWIGMILAVFLFGESQFGNTVTVASITLDKMDTPTKFLLGLVLGSTASALVDFKQAFDNTDDASKPPLIK
jgi:hypothetical protein